MPMNSPFHTPAFSMAALTAAINLLPNRYGRLGALNLFPVKPLRQRQILVEERNGALNLLPTLPPGSPGTVGRRGKRTLRSFIVPHIPHDDVVLPEEVQVLINDMRAGFTYGGLTFEEYRGQATDADGVSRRFIAAGEGHCFPQGTVDIFGTYVAPADFNETVNTLGQPL